LKPLQALNKNPQQLSLQLDFFSELPETAAVAPTPGAAPAPPVRTRADGVRQMLLQGQYLEYKLNRSKRRTIGFLINEDGLRVTAPKWVALADIEQAIQEKQHWIFNKLAESRARLAKKLQPAMSWQDGARFPFLGQHVTLRLHQFHNVSAQYDPERLELALSLPPDAEEQQVKDRVLAWLQQQARQIFANRLPVYAEKLGVRFHSFALSSANTRWGSCTSQGKIRLNWRLIHLSLPLIDYVIAHELSHLKEMNHSPRFWATVQSVFPDFEQARRILRKEASSDLPQF
jgi:predicted metal-dependent hydrolase